MERNIKTICLALTAFLVTPFCADVNTANAQNSTRNTRAIAPTSKRVPTRFSTQDPFQKQAAAKQAAALRAGAPQGPASRAEPEDPTEAFRRSAKIEFNFQGVPYREVIDWFAEQGKFSTNYQVPAPPGSFTYKKNGAVSINEGLDILNSQLELENHQLIRNRETLILTNTANGYPWDLVEDVFPHQLDSRAEFEVVRCIFSPSVPLTGSTIIQEIQQIAGANAQKGFNSVYSASSNKLFVREKVRNLLKIRDMLADLKKPGANIYHTYRVQNVEPEALMINVRQLMFFPPGESFSLADQTFTISIEALGSRMFLKGTQEKIDEFLRIAAMVDVPFAGEDVAFDPPYFKTYPISTDPETTFKILNSFFDGEQGVKMDQDPITGNIYLLGNKKQHETALKLLAELLDGDGGGFKIVRVYNEDPDDIVDDIETLLNIDTIDTAQNGPTLVSDYEKGYILVSGTPPEITKVEAMIKELDAFKELDDDRPRRNTAFFELSPTDSDRVMSALNDGRFGEFGRNNKLNLMMITPDQRSKMQQRIRQPQLEQQQRDFERMQEEVMNDPKLDRPAGSSTKSREPAGSDTRSRQPAGSDNRSEQPAGSNTRTQPLNRKSTLARAAAAHYVRIQQDSQTPFQEGPTQTETQDVGDSSQESANQANENGYKPAPERKSVPGAPVTVRQTESGILITSDDLDAVDDLSYMIKNMTDEVSADIPPTLLYFERRLVTEAKTLLEELVGLGGGGGGGGGGGAGGLLGGVLSNAVPGVGDALGGLLGGGGGGSDFGSSAVELEGDVSFVIDSKHNALWVLGATENDLDRLLDYVAVIDGRPPIDPRTSGRTRVLKVSRDAEELRAIVETNFPDVRSSAPQQQAGGGNAAAAQQRQVLQAVQQLAGGGNKGGNRGSANPEQERPYATIGVDVARNALLITGPEHIFLRVKKFVEESDQVPVKETKTVKVDGVPNTELIEFLKLKFGDMIVTGDEEDGAAPTAAAGAGARGGRATGTNRANPNSGAPNAAALQNFIRQAQGGRGGQGRGGRGGQGRGGR